MRQLRKGEQFFLKFPPSILCVYFLSRMEIFDLICYCCASSAFHMKNSKFGTNPERLNKSKPQREAREMLLGMKRRCGRLLYPGNAAKLSACESVLIGLTQTHSQPARTPMSPVMKVSYLRLCFWTWTLFFCLIYYKLPLTNPKSHDLVLNLR